MFKKIESVNFYITTFLFFPTASVASNYGSREEFLLSYFLYGLCFGLVVYFVLGCILFYLKRDRFLNTKLQNVPSYIVFFGVTLLSISELVLMGIISGVFGGSLLGGILSGVIYYLVLRKVKYCEKS